MQLRNRVRASKADEGEIDLTEPSPGKTLGKANLRSSGAAENAAAGPSRQPQKAKPKKAKPRPLKKAIAEQASCAELVHLVIATCGRKDLFDKPSLRALRATSKTLKALLDSLFPLSKIECASSRLEDLIRCTSMMEKLQQLTLK